MSISKTQYVNHAFMAQIVISCDCACHQSKAHEIHGLKTMVRRIRKNSRELSPFCISWQNLFNNTIFGKNLVASTHLKLFSKLDCFLKIEFVKHEFQPEIEYLKLDLCLTDARNLSILNSSSMLLKKITQMEGVQDRYRT